MIARLLIALLLTASRRLPPSKSRGTVVREDKQEPSSVTQANQVRISGPSTTIVPIKPGGSFEFPSVRPGTYRLGSWANSLDATDDGSHYRQGP
jgi:hypothetical protein